MSGADDLGNFEAHRRRAFDVAYRMTGSVSDADDICQEAWLRWSSADRTDVHEPEGWLVRTVVNLAIDRSRSAHQRRVSYVGPFLPEPLAYDERSPEAHAELADSVTFAFLVLLDELEPVARVVLLLHDVFGHNFDEVASLVGRSPAACRQLASRSRARLAAAQIELRRPDPGHEQQVINSLASALFAGDEDAVIALLADDVVQVSDGGPNRRAARNPIIGPHRVARLLINLAKRIPPGAEVEMLRLNANPAAVVRLENEVLLVSMFEFAPDGAIRRIWDVVNPDKLGHLRLRP